MNFCSAIIVAGGESLRMKTPLPKPYIELQGKPIIVWTLTPFDELKVIDEIILVVHEKWIDYCKDIVKKFNFKKVKSIVKGGTARQDSVKEGLSLVNTDFVLIHDAVRPFITKTFINNLIKFGKEYGAVVPGIPVVDTIKEVKNDFAHHTLQRGKIYKIQTPQVFKTDILKKAYGEAYNAGFYGTDSSMLVEKIGVKVRIVKGLKENIKITTQEDLVYAETLLRKINAKLTINN
ncbi:2-C-methyl-D-erythritol 4-phosphate cytidylyltransferase [candidate division WOR-3 bacterium]|nr:2-C-methyl-D-erythritol 4-phosphate cytidylyltransferase [candidate division WOR-3 bacterium]